MKVRSSRSRSRQRKPSPAMERHAGFAGLELPPPTALLKCLEQVPAGIASSWTRYANAILTEGRIPPALRELAILRTAAHCRTAYVLGPHKLIGRHVGLGERDIELVIDLDCVGGDFVDEPVAGAILSATDWLLGAGDIEGSARSTLAERLGPGSETELAMVVGQYVTVSLICRVNRLKPEPTEAGEQ